ncbi:hypothetical protein [Arsenicicoccus dermatophilus]
MPTGAARPARHPPSPRPRHIPSATVGLVFAMMGFLSFLLAPSAAP